MREFQRIYYRIKFLYTNLIDSGTMYKHIVCMVMSQFFVISLNSEHIFSNFLRNCFRWLNFFTDKAFIYYLPKDKAIQ